MSLDITKQYFKYNFNASSSYAFSALHLNFFVKNVLAKRKDKASTHLYFRLFRTGIIGDILYKAGKKRVDHKDHQVNNEILAALFEGYLTLARSIYDYLLIFLKEQYGVSQTSYNKFLNRVRNGKYKNIDVKFKKHLENKIFSDLRNLRDSVVHKTANIFIFTEDEEYRVTGTIYRDDGTRGFVDESLYRLIFGYTTSLLLLMSYIAQKETGKTFKEQMEILDKTPHPEEGRM